MTHLIKVLLLTLILLTFTPSTGATPQQFENTLAYKKSEGSPSASIDSVAWISGSWTGEVWGGHFEEIWSTPSAGSMMGVFKHFEQGKIKFYEFITIKQENNSLVLRLKHFDEDLKGWEAKDQSLEFKLVKISDDKVYFDNYTFEKASDNQINVYVVIGKEPKEQKFIFKRAK